jgi:hypothetical protein
MKALKRYALHNRTAGTLDVVVAADMLAAAMDAYADAAGGETGLWYRLVPTSQVHEFLTMATCGYTVYEAPQGWRPSQGHEGMLELFELPVAGHVEITWPEDRE